MDLKKKIRSFLLAEFKDEGFTNNIGDDESLLDMDIMDSLGVLTVLSFLDDEFGISAEPDELVPENFDTISSICLFIENNMYNE